MKVTQWMGPGFLAAGLLCVGLWSSPVSAQTTVISQLATWDTAPTGSVFAGGDFDPTLDNTPTCSGCWYGKASGSGISYSSSTAHKTQGTGALKAVITGKGTGGQYTVTVNGSPVTLTTHYDDPLLVSYSNSTAANGGVLDSRFTALEGAIDSGQQALYNIEFDIIYDVASMRAAPWQPPEETVNPTGPNGRYPQRYFWTGSFGGANDSFQFVCNDCNTIQPFDTQYDSNLFPVFHAKIPLSAFNFIPDATPGQHTFRQLGMLYNSVFGTLPASANTSSVTLYLDNLQLTKLNPIGPIDYNNDGLATAADWNLFMAQYLVTGPPASANPNASFDLVGNFGAAGTNGKVDFFDLQKFQEYYKIANPGAGASLPWATSVPEPSALVLGLIAIVGWASTRSRSRSRLLLAAPAGVVAFFLSQQTANAQLVEGFETIGKWQANAGADPAAQPITVGLSTNGATQGTKSLKITQGHDNINAFTWNATTNPGYTAGDSAWDVLSHAVRVGADHYNLLIDTTYDPADLGGVNTLQMYFGLNFVAQPTALYSGESTKVTTTTTIPLSAFNLPDAVDQGATSYSAQIAFAADAPGLGGLSFSAYVDNIRLQQISTPDLLTLQVDRGTGVGTLKNLSTNPISWNLFDIKSTGGSLNPTGWSSLHDQNADGAGTWQEAGGSTASEIAEASLAGSHTLAAGASLSLGTLYNPAVHVDDLNFTIRPNGGLANRTYDQLVTYVGTAPVGVNGDYNGNGKVDMADYIIWRSHLGQTFQLQNEGGISAGVVDQADYTYWKSRFGATSGSGSGLGGSAVPEPTGVALLCIGFAAFFVGKSRR